MLKEMKSTKFHFADALTVSGWESDVCVEIDPSGMIGKVSANSKDGQHIKGIAIPAMPNVHSHAHQRLMAGLAEVAGPGADSFWTWREAMYGFALRLGPQDLEAVAAQLYVEMLKGGFSAVGEFQYLHHQPDGIAYENPAELSLRCIAAAEQAGIGMTMLPCLYSFGGLGGQDSTPAQRRFVNTPDTYLKIHEILRKTCNTPMRFLGISPHSLRAVTLPVLEQVLQAIDPLSVVHIHIAEQVREVADCVAWSGRRPVSHLLENLDISNRWCCIHATHMTEAETVALAATGAVAGLCPTTEANLGDGIFPATRFLESGGAIAIGTDSQITVSPAEDLRMLEYSQRLRDLTRNALAGGPAQSTGRTVFDKALSGGAQALGQPIGVIAQGYRADIAILDDDHPSLVGRSGDNILDSWIFSGGNACVKDMIAGGRHVIVDRHHRDEAAIAAAFRKTVRGLT